MERTVTGIDADITIERDRYGIPRVRASSLSDLFFGQGYATATDRLAQLDWDRRRGLGRTAERYGTRANIVTDSTHRRLRLAEHAQAGYAALDETTRSVLDAYVQGVNAAAVRLGPPAEYQALGIDEPVEPWEPWTPVLVFLVRHINFATWQTKLWNARALHALGPEGPSYFRREGRHGTTPLIVPEGATQALAELSKFVIDADVAHRITEELRPLGMGESGSNAWAVHGSHTSSGAPLLAGDPHRAIELPGVYYQVHLEGPDIDVSGLAFVGVPGVQHFAQTDAVAWGVTNAMADYQDLFIESLPDAITDHRVETVEVRDGEAVDIECVMTKNGPIVIGDTNTGVGLALTTTGLIDPGGSLRTILPFLRARSVDEFDAALSHWVEPANNFVIADRAGHIAYRTAGRIPRRHELNQHVPVPGDDPRYAWTGLIDFEALPQQRDTPMIITANQRIAGGEIGEALSVDYALAARAERIRTRFDAIGTRMATGASSERHSIDDQRQIQMDDVWLPGLGLAQRLVALSDDPTLATEPIRAAAAELGSWDGRLSADSQTASLMMRTFAALVRRVVAALPETLRSNPFAPWEPPGTTMPIEARVAEGLCTRLDGGDDELIPGLRWTEYLADAFVAACGEAPTPWGELHRLQPVFALRGANASLDDRVAIAAPPLAGGRNCVLATAQFDGLYTHTTVGPTARYIWDLSDRSRSRWVVPLGASGDPDSPHFADQLDAWSSGELMEVLAAPISTVQLRSHGV